MFPTADRTLVMGILNITPDSFSDGGKFLNGNIAFEHALAMVEQGADIIDVGGESTRPGALRVGEAEEQDRILPIIKKLADEGVCVSVDTMRAATATRAIDAGARIVNDVSGGLADADMARAVAAGGAGFIAMHWRGHSDHMDQLAQYNDVVEEVVHELSARVQALQADGIKEIAIDPGLGFAKDPEHNWALLTHLDRLTALGYPLLIGASRKRFLGRLLAEDGIDREIDQREAATVAITALAARAGAWAVRVHDIRGNADAVRVAAAWGRT
jgi:dihydropteroate synthase